MIPPVRHTLHTGTALQWEATPRKAYKPEGTHFLDITRQVLFDEAVGLPTELRYFEIAPDGHSTLEQHAHIHAVVVLHGRGRVLIGEAIYPIQPYDLVHIAPHTWHQFRADADAPLGFLCLVACRRDRPVRPTADDAERLKAHPVAGTFVRL